MENWDNDTGMCLRIILNGDGPFMRKYGDEWTTKLQAEFEQNYKNCNNKAFGDNVELSFNDKTQSYQFWCHLPRQKFPNRANIETELN